jgi:lipopolysaccharide/colanic/teichoic acid biosynthesis glycosyltransferase
MPGPSIGPSLRATLPLESNANVNSRNCATYCAAISSKSVTNSAVLGNCVPDVKIAGSGTFLNCPVNRSFYLNYGKRLVDIMLALVGLLLFGVPMLFVALVILLVDGSPMFFGQRRVGLGGKLFTLHKYRTMRNRKDAGSSITVAGDPRVSVLGRTLRQFKIDELPQLFNVLRGDMSFVGPRPDVAGYADQLQGEARVILLLRPGITGPATLAFRNEEELLARVADPKAYNDEVIFPEKVRLNMEYAKAVTLRNDVGLVLRTIFSRTTAERPAN